MKNTPICITIAGSDSCGGAGIQADIKAFSAQECYAMSVITASTAQTHLGIDDIHALPSAHIEKQLICLLTDYTVSAIKTGMFASPEQILTVSEVLKRFEYIPIIVDPVLGSSTGSSWSTEALIDAYKRALFPLATLITPNTHEAIQLFGETPDALISFAEQYDLAILLKGGHEAHQEHITDRLIQTSSTQDFRHPRITSSNTHGTGCSLASAIAAHIAQGKDLALACELGIAYVEELLRSSQDFLADQSKAPLTNLPMNHFFGW